MLKFLFSATLSFFLLSCNIHDFKETKGGLKYKIVLDKAGDTTKVGDMIILNIRYENAKDTFNTYTNGSPINEVLDTSAIFPGSIEEGLLLLSSGDSAIFKVSNAILYSKSFKMEIPKELDSLGRTTFFVKVDTVYKREVLLQEQKKMLKEQTAAVQAYKKKLLDSTAVQSQMAIDKRLILSYLDKNNLKASPTSNGVYVAVTDSGTGKAAQEGNIVIASYEGKILQSGRVFQNSDAMGKPFQFVLGAGQAVLGWDEGIEGLREGASAILLIPSSLAYGKNGIPNQQGEYLIPPNAPVIFEVKIEQVKEM